MRKYFAALCVASFTHAATGHSEQLTEFQAAGFSVAVAASCNAIFGDTDLFEAAFSEYEEEAMRQIPPKSGAELTELRDLLLSAAAPEGDREVFATICDLLRDRLLPAD